MVLNCGLQEALGSHFEQSVFWVQVPDHPQIVYDGYDHVQTILCRERHEVYLHHMHQGQASEYESCSIQSQRDDNIHTKIPWGWFRKTDRRAFLDASLYFYFIKEALPRLAPSRICVERT